MFERLKRLRERRARKLLKGKPVYLDGTHYEIVTPSTTIKLKVGGGTYWRGTWLEPRSTWSRKRANQVLEIRRQEETCKDYNQLLTHGELEGRSTREAVEYIGMRGVTSTETRDDRKCVGKIVEWFKERVRAEL